MWSPPLDTLDPRARAMAAVLLALAMYVAASGLAQARWLPAPLRSLALRLDAWRVERLLEHVARAVLNLRTRQMWAFVARARALGLAA